MAAARRRHRRGPGVGVVGAGAATGGSRHSRSRATRGCAVEWRRVYRSDVRGGRRLLAVSGGGAAGAERGGAGDEPVAQVRAAAAEPLPAAAPALHALLRHRHSLPHRGVQEARAEQPAVPVQVRRSIGGRHPRVVTRI